MIKVMVVEDEPEIRKILKKMIEKQDGFQVGILRAELQIF